MWMQQLHGQRRSGVVAVLGIAMLAGLAGCAQGEAGASAPTPAPSAASPTPTPSAALSREAELAVERCTDALREFGPRLHYWVAEPSEYSRAKAESSLAAVDDTCDEAATQVGVDGFAHAALMLRQHALDRMKVSLAISMGNPEPLTDEDVDYYQLLGPVTQWTTALKVELGIYPASATQSP